VRRTWKRPRKDCQLIFTVSSYIRADYSRRREKEGRGTLLDKNQIAQEIAQDVMGEFQKRIVEIRDMDSQVQKIMREILRYHALKCLEKYGEIED
jgi:hypothetical protein